MPHFEIHVTDSARARTFYSGLFGWTFAPIPGAEDMDYHIASGRDLGGVLTVGMMRRLAGSHDGSTPIRGGTMSFRVDDCDAAYDWALSHGGGETLPPGDYPGFGRAAYVEDGEGNVVGMFTPEKEG